MERETLRRLLRDTRAARQCVEGSLVGSPQRCAGEQSGGRIELCQRATRPSRQA